MTFQSICYAAGIAHTLQYQSDGKAKTKLNKIPKTFLWGYPYRPSCALALHKSKYLMKPWGEKDSLAFLSAVVCFFCVWRYCLNNELNVVRLLIPVVIFFFSTEQFWSTLCTFQRTCNRTPRQVFPLLRIFHRSHTCSAVPPISPH